VNDGSRVIRELLSFALKCAHNSSDRAAHTSTNYQLINMAEIVSFNQALERCGITTAVTRNAINNQGYTSMEEFAQLTDKDILALAKEVNKMSLIPPLVLGPRIPFASIKKLRAMRWWMIEQRRTGQDVVHAAFTLAEKDRGSVGVDGF